MEEYLLELVPDLTSGRTKGNGTLVEIGLGRLQGAFWSLLPGGSCLSFSRLELSCAVNLLSKQASVLFAMPCRRSALFLRVFSITGAS
jgi:hypothetical protein